MVVYCSFERLGLLFICGQNNWGCTNKRDCMLFLCATVLSHFKLLLYLLSSFFKPALCNYVSSAAAGINVELLPTRWLQLLKRTVWCQAVASSIPFCSGSVGQGNCAPFPEASCASRHDKVLKGAGRKTLPFLRIPTQDRGQFISKHLNYNSLCVLILY